MPFRSYYYSEDGVLESELSTARISEVLRGGRGLLWVDIYETTPQDGALLEEVFRFHRLTIEDCVERQIHSPKIDDYQDYLFVILHGINHTAESAVVETAELALYLGPNYVVSNHNLHLYSVEEVRHHVETSGRPLHRGADYLVYSLIDALVDNVLPTIDLLNEISARIEEDAIGAPQESTLDAILRIKRSVRSIHRTMAPQREMLNRLSRGEYRLIQDTSLFYFRDIYDHLVLIEDLLMSIRDGVDNALATYLSAVGNRQNETMKVLTIVGSIFLPLTLLAGIYGMNFEYMPELSWRYGYFVVLGIMLTTIATAMVIFWRRGWLRAGHAGAEIAKTFAVERGLLRGHHPRHSLRRTAVSQEARAQREQGLDGGPAQT